jgi:hypothetical protein
MSFSSLSATSSARARMQEPKLLLAWAYLTQLLPLSEFLTPSGFCFSHTLAALFHAAATHRVWTPWSISTRVATSQGRCLTFRLHSRPFVPPAAGAVEGPGHKVQTR